MQSPIPIRHAKEQLQRINDFLEEPHLLIGGLAVNQYVTTRRSLDIDLICSDETAQKILKQLYPSDQWSREQTGDEYRPTHYLTSRAYNSKIEIVFGPKIIERGPYRHLDWDLLKGRGRPFELDGERLSKIIVPSCAGLIFSKLLSFTSRSYNQEMKRNQDLDDIVELSNIEFSLADLRVLLDSIEDDDLITKFFEALQTDDQLRMLQRSSLHDMLKARRQERYKRPTESEISGDILPGASSAAEKREYGLQLDGIWTAYYVEDDRGVDPYIVRETLTITQAGNKLHGNYKCESYDRAAIYQMNATVFDQVVVGSYFVPERLSDSGRGFFELLASRGGEWFEGFCTWFDDDLGRITCSKNVWVRRDSHYFSEYEDQAQHLMNLELRLLKHRRTLEI